MRDSSAEILFQSFQHLQQFSSVQFGLLTNWVAGGTWEMIQQRSSSTLFFFFFLRDTIVNSSGMGTDVHSSTLFIRHFLCWHTDNLCFDLLLFKQSTLPSLWQMLLTSYKQLLLTSYKQLLLTSNKQLLLTSYKQLLLTSYKQLLLTRYELLLLTRYKQLHLIRYKQSLLTSYKQLLLISYKKSLSTSSKQVKCKHTMFMIDRLGSKHQLTNYDWPFDSFVFAVCRSSGLAKTINCKAQWKGEEDKPDRRRCGKTSSGNGQAWSWGSPRGQWRTGKIGENWLQNHLWCPNDSRG